MKSKEIKNQVLIIFGASGDLTYRKLIPAVFDLYKQGSLPEHYAVLGVSRTFFSDDSFREKMKKGIKQFATTKDLSDEDLNRFCQMLHYLPLETDKGDEYSKLKKRLDELDKKESTDSNYIFYLSTPPSLYSVIPNFLVNEGLNNQEKGFRRIIIEKPFGTDLESAIKLNKELQKNYSEDQIYRIDHYLGKETVQNILVTRFANGIFEPIWNRNFIQHIEVTAAESLGVEGRGGYYDHFGALRDMVQNHLLQVVALVAMEPPMSLDSEAIRNEKLKVFQALRPMTPVALTRDVIRGQYTAATVRDKNMKGYRDEKDVDPNSRTETYVAMKLYIDNWRWGGVPFYIRTGKRLPTRVSEIVIHFRSAPHKLFVENKESYNPDNQLILRIQPNEGILLKTGLKVPGSGYNVRNVNIDFHYSDMQGTYVPEAYERLILDCMIGDSTLYIRADALEATWRFVQPVLDYWQNDKDAPLYGYPSGTWGPECADKIFEGQGTWRYPCKNLSDDGIFCEL